MSLPLDNSGSSQHIHERHEIPAEPMNILHQINIMIPSSPSSSSLPFASSPQCPTFYTKYPQDYDMPTPAIYDSSALAQLSSYRKPFVSSSIISSYEYRTHGRNDKMHHPNAYSYSEKSAQRNEEDNSFVNLQYPPFHNDRSTKADVSVYKEQQMYATTSPFPNDKRQTNRSSFNKKMKLKRKKRQNNLTRILVKVKIHKIIASNVSMQHHLHVDMHVKMALI